MAWLPELLLDPVACRTTRRARCSLVDEVHLRALVAAEPVFQSTPRSDQSKSSIRGLTSDLQ